MRFPSFLAPLSQFGLQSSIAQAAIKTQYVDYKHGNTQLKGYLAYDAAGQWRSSWWTGVPAIGMIAVHGSFRNFTPEAAKNIKGRVLILHGAEDEVAPLNPCTPSRPRVRGRPRASSRVAAWRRSPRGALAPPSGRDPDSRLTDA